MDRLLHNEDNGHQHDLTCFLMVSVLHSLNLTSPYHQFGFITFPRIGIIIPSEDKGRHIGYESVSHHIEEEGEDTKLSPRTTQPHALQELVDSDAEKPVKGKILFIEVRAHKCVLTARAGYFKSLFRKEAFRESSDCTINVEDFSSHIVRLTLEFIYTNRIEKISKISTDDLLSLLHLSDIWLLRDLKRLAKHELSRSHMDVNTVARMYGATEDHNAPRLSKACLDFIMENIHEVTANVAFQEEM